MNKKQFTVNLKDAIFASRNKRASKAMKILKESLKKKLKAEELKISHFVNEEIWKRGVRFPPSKISVQVVEQGGVFYVELAGKEFALPVKKEKKAKEKVEGEKTEVDLKAKEGEKEKPAGKKEERSAVEEVEEVKEKVKIEGKKEKSEKKVEKVEKEGKKKKVGKLEKAKEEKSIENEEEQERTIKKTEEKETKEEKKKEVKGTKEENERKDKKKEVKAKEKKSSIPEALENVLKVGSIEEAKELIKKMNKHELEPVLNFEKANQNRKELIKFLESNIR